MVTLTFHVKDSQLYSHWDRRLFLLLKLALVAGFLVVFAIVGRMQSDLGAWLILALLFVVFVAGAVHTVRHSSKAENYLRLDDEGLARASWGRIRRWTWREVVRFEIPPVERLWFLPAGDRYVPILKPGAGALSRFRATWR